MREIRPVERWQRLRLHQPEEDIDLDPERIGTLYLSNIVQRVVARLYGKKDDKLVPVLSDGDGHLQVTSESEVPDALDCTADTAGDAYGDPVEFDFTSRVVTVWAETNGLDIQLVLTSGSYSDVVYIPADTAVSLGFQATGYRVKNHSAGSNSAYQVLATTVG